LKRLQVMIRNLQLFQEARFYAVDETTAKSRLKTLQKDIRSVSFKRLAAADSIRTLAAALASGLGWGLETYVPQIRLLPGQDFILAPKTSAERPNLTLLCDEEPAQICAASYLRSCGLRIHVCKDAIHRSDNNSNLADKRADLGCVSLRSNTGIVTFIVVSCVAAL
jgi:hypothetical protein